MSLIRLQPACHPVLIDEAEAFGRLNIRATVSSPSFAAGNPSHLLPPDLNYWYSAGKPAAGIHPVARTRRQGEKEFQTMVRSAMIGARVRRKEDPRLITGASLYVDDLQMAGTAHLVLLRSPFAHARIRSIDTSAAESAPGVIAVYTNEKLRQFCGPMPGGGGGEGTPIEEDDTSPAAGGTSGETAGELEEIVGPIPTPNMEPLADGKVRWVGESVVAIVAESVAQGRDAADLIEVDYEELPVLADMDAAIAPGAPRIWDDIRRNVGVVRTQAWGDAEAAFSNAEVTVSQRIRSQRVIPMPLEGRAVAAQPDPMSGGLTVWTSTQAPHWTRRDLATQLNLSESQIRVIAPEVGGGFGAKIGVYPEDLMVAALAGHLKRPVKWVESRSENFVATNHGRRMDALIELAATKEGKLTAMRLHVDGDAGAYPMGLDLPVTATLMAVGCYDIPAGDLRARAVYTNTMAVGAYRGAGRPEAAFFIERAMSMLAQQLGKDPAEIRRINFLQPDQFPYTTPAAPSWTYDTGEYEKALDKALEVSGYAQLRQQQEEARSQGRLMGIGLASYVEICGFGPYESSSIRVEPSGAVSIYTGISPHGQGQETTFAQMAHDHLGADFDDITVHHGDTASNPQGNGTMGSRGLAVGGAALMMSIEKIREKAFAIAGHKLEVAASDIELRDGKYSVKGSPDQSLTLAEIADIAYGGNLPENIDSGLVTTDFFRTSGETYPFGTHIAVVEIDPETGETQVQRFVTVDDCGQVISPILVDGQVHGGLAQGIGQALYEEAVYDDNGQLLSSTLMDYALPKAANFPMFELNRTVTPTHLNPMGVKGIGEAATIGATPAVVNAVMDALAPHGITHLDMPLSPSKIWAALHEA
jgi:aerobic carbon-monoxide dehydrogenase large subunit